MEIVAMDMKLRGMYIARQLSFHGVTFKIDEVPLSKEFEKVYDESVLLVSVAAQQRRTHKTRCVPHFSVACRSLTTQKPKSFHFSGSKRCKNSPKQPS